MENVFFEKKMGRILIRALEGSEEPKMEAGILTVYGYSNGYQDYQTADISADNKIIQVKTMRNLGYEPEFKTYYYVWDYGIYNKRYKPDMSIIKNLEKVGANQIKKSDRNIIELKFGSTQAAKEALEIVIKKLKKRFETTSYEEPVRLRPWDQTKEMLIDPKKTKLKCFVSKEIIPELGDFIEETGYENEAKKIKIQRTRSLFEIIETSIDFSHYFKKKK